MTRPAHWARHNEKRAHQIAADLEGFIKQGFYKQNEALPHTHSLRRIYGVGDPCLTRVRQILVEKGLVKAVKGKGTFVL